MARPLRREQRTRLHIDLPLVVKERAEKLRVLTNAESLGEVLRRALAVYDLLVTHRGRSTVVLRDESGKEREIVIV